MLPCNYCTKTTHYKASLLKKAYTIVSVQRLVIKVFYKHPSIHIPMCIHAYIHTYSTEILIEPQTSPLARRGMITHEESDEQTHTH